MFFKKKKKKQLLPNHAPNSLLKFLKIFCSNFRMHFASYVI